MTDTLTELYPFVVACFVAWAGWLTKTVVDMKTNSAKIDQRLNDFIDRYYKDHISKK
jgi:hypothetical protein